MKKKTKIDTWNSKTQKLHQVLRARDPDYTWTLAEFRYWLTTKSSDCDGGQRWTCVYCLSTLSYRAVSIDHIVPLKRDDLGQHAPYDLQVTCKDCNQIKRDQSDWEMLRMMALLDSFPPAGRKLLFQRLRQRPIQLFFSQMVEAKATARALSEVGRVIEASKT